ncbi:helix-turn-helix transcriptional regulator [Pectobacterium polaris]|uniref:helix-turn-helix transcriptional regulator n=1 Tax=Pectobacterium polaris TaxID=2042057 RepID=UPI000F8D9FB8|nr:PAS domain-containing protein [Pectobacterium polaris]RUS00729.1 DNA-binding protein [Pectobacterium polaris]
MASQHNDKQLSFNTLKSMADGIAALFFPAVEVAIHDVKKGKVAYLANNLSRRQIGDDAGLEQLELGELSTLTGPYEKLNWDGRKMRSVSILIPQQDSLGYVFCINFSTARFEDARNALDLFLSVNRLQPQPTQLFEHDWQEKINTYLHAWLAENNTSLTTLTRSQKKAVVVSLYNQGAFNVRNSADYIAKVLSMGRATVYKHIKEIR